MAWPYFRDTIDDDTWHDAKAEQDFRAKRIMIVDAKRLPGLSPSDFARLQDENGRPGPAPHWLLELLARGKRA
jgi:hypothetical protein